MEENYRNETLINFLDRVFVRTKLGDYEYEFENSNITLKYDINLKTFNLNQGYDNINLGHLTSPQVEKLLKTLNYCLAK